MMRSNPKKATTALVETDSSVEDNAGREKLGSVATPLNVLENLKLFIETAFRMRARVN